LHGKNRNSTGLFAGYSMAIDRLAQAVLAVTRSFSMDWEYS